MAPSPTDHMVRAILLDVANTENDKTIESLELVNAIVSFLPETVFCRLPYSDDIHNDRNGCTVSGHAGATLNTVSNFCSGGHSAHC